ncbi:MAG: YqiA/YcfP family alpha/beta fold hydrolase [Pseudomonadales bacterium]
MKRLVYLHGFLSSPESLKALLTKSWLERNRPDIEYQCPELSSYPGQAIKAIRELMAMPYEQTMLVGSSLGGYWSTWLAEEYGHRTVVINPAVKPSMLNREDYLGVELKNYYSDEVYTLGDRDAEDLLSVFVDEIKYPERIWLMAQTGDDTCDYRLAVEKYADCKQLIEEGGDHGFQGYEEWIPEIVRFLEKN